MDYLTISETATKWGVSERWVYKYLKDGRVRGAIRFGAAWMVPAGAEKPGDPRREKKAPRDALLSDLIDIFDATPVSMPQKNAGDLINTIGEERLRLHYDAEIAYLRGDFERTKECFRKTEGDDASRLRICSVVIAAAISTGDYTGYLEIENFLKDFIKENENDEISVFAQLCLATAYTGALVPDMVPEWLKRGDFELLHDKMKPDATYKRAKYFQCLEKYESMLAVAETALEFCSAKSGITFHGIYFRVLCAVACCALERRDEAKQWLLSAMRIALPHGFITPFAESATAFHGLLEPLLEQEYPEHYDAVLGQWKSTFTNWVTFHNRFTKENITQILSLREYQITLLAARGVPFRKIAEQFHMSLGTLNNNMQVIYKKLFISGKKELSDYIL